MDDESSSAIRAMTEAELDPRSGVVVAEAGVAGRHHPNEDARWAGACADGSHLLIVCDGMGGMGRGDEASRMTVEILRERLSEGGSHDPAALITDAIRDADVAIRARWANEARHPGSTAVVVHIRDGFATVGWVGDSRAYHVQNGKVTAKTRDHRVIEELIESGALTREAARSSPMARFLARSVGGRGIDHPVVQVATTGPWFVRRGDAIVLCTDGLWDWLSDDDIAQMATRSTPTEAARAMVDEAYVRESSDNITCVVARVVGASTEGVSGATWVPRRAPKRPVDLDSDLMRKPTPPPLTPPPAPGRSHDEGGPPVTLIVTALSVFVLLMGATLFAIAVMYAS